MSRLPLTSSVMVVYVRCPFVDIQWNSRYVLDHPRLEAARANEQDK